MDLSEFTGLVAPISMTSNERIVALYNSLEYIRLNGIEGDLVECGVWKGGNILGILQYLDYHGMTDRVVWLYDTFEGMTKSEDVDVDLNGHSGSVWEGQCDSSLDEVRSILSVSSFPVKNIRYVVGDVCDTLGEPVNLPSSISLLRLDTDWYKSTKKEMEVLYPLLRERGVLIVDDYGHWRGSRQAVDEYFAAFESVPVIEQIDYTGIKIVK